VNTGELLQRLHRHYIKPSEPMPGGVFLSEVQSYSTAPTTRIDALYFGFTRSRGCLLQGHELKVSRSDWLHELDQPHKADWWHRHTHQWWIVVPDLTIAKPEELPEGWGLMVVNPRTKTRLDIVVKAEKRQAVIDFGLLFEMSKKLDTMRLLGERAAYDKARSEVRPQVQAEANRAQEHILERALAAEQKLVELEAMTGLLFAGDWWRNKELERVDGATAATLIRQFCQGEAARHRIIEHSTRTLAGIANQAKAIVKEAEEVVNAEG
jgi:hypothetical protein